MFIQKCVYAMISRPVSLMVRLGITPNTITVASLAGSAAASALIVYSAADGGYDSLTVAGVMLLLFSALDMVDGYMARTHGMCSAFGAFLDSVADRYGELLSLAAISVWLDYNVGLWCAVVTYTAVAGSVMVSYTRARAEALGVECKVGFMQRPERVVLTAVSLIVAGMTGCCEVLWGAMAVISVAANFTALWRVLYVRSHLNPPVENERKKP